MGKPYPELPCSIDKEISWKSQTGERRVFTIVGEIRRVQSDAPRRKSIYLQRMRYERPHSRRGRIVFRFGYYMIGSKPGPSKGRWVWGQYALMIPKQDIRWLVRKAERLGWF